METFTSQVIWLDFSQFLKPWSDPSKISHTHIHRKDAEIALNDNIEKENPLGLVCLHKIHKN